MESRAFPATPTTLGGPNWASRFHLEANTQVEADWPVQEFSYEDENHQRVCSEAGFTFVDFVACDQRHAAHFARVPRAKWNAKMIPVDEYLRRDAREAQDTVPYVTLVIGTASCTAPSWTTAWSAPRCVAGNRGTAAGARRHPQLARRTAAGEGQEGP